MSMSARRPTLCRMNYVENGQPIGSRWIVANEVYRSDGGLRNKILYDGPDEAEARRIVALARQRHDELRGDQ